MSHFTGDFLERRAWLVTLSAPLTEDDIENIVKDAGGSTAHPDSGRPLFLS
jgi:hypothetical protein